MTTSSSDLREVLQELMGVSQAAAGISGEYFGRVYDKAQSALDGTLPKVRDCAAIAGTGCCSESCRSECTALWF